MAAILYIAKSKPVVGESIVVQEYNYRNNVLCSASYETQFKVGAIEPLKNFKGVVAITDTNGNRYLTIVE